MSHLMSGNSANLLNNVKFDVIIINGKKCIDCEHLIFKDLLATVQCVVGS